MMPFLPIVRVPDFDAAIAAALQAEHGYRHTAIIHSQERRQRDRDGARHEHDALRPQRARRTAALGLGGAGLPELHHRHADRRGRHHAPHVHARAADRHRRRAADHLRPCSSRASTAPDRDAQARDARGLPLPDRASASRPTAATSGEPLVRHRPPRRAPRHDRPRVDRRRHRSASCQGNTVPARLVGRRASSTRSAAGGAGDEARHRARARGPPHGGARARRARGCVIVEPVTAANLAARQRPGRRQGARRRRPPRPRPRADGRRSSRAARPRTPTGRAGPRSTRTALSSSTRSDFQPPRERRKRKTADEDASISRVCGSSRRRTSRTRCARARPSWRSPRARSSRRPRATRCAATAAPSTATASPGRRPRARTPPAASAARRAPLRLARGRGGQGRDHRRRPEALAAAVRGRQRRQHLVSASAENAVLCTPDARQQGRPDARGPLPGRPRRQPARRHARAHERDPDAPGDLQEPCRRRRRWCTATRRTPPPTPSRAACRPTCVIPEFEVFVGSVALSPYETPGTQKFAETVLPFVKNHNTRAARRTTASSAGPTP